LQLLRLKNLLNFNIVKNIKARENRGMEPFRLPSAEEINNAYDQGKEAGVVLFSKTFSELAEQGWNYDPQDGKTENAPALLSAILPSLFGI
jgi:hypothetical protein